MKKYVYMFLAAIVIWLVIDALFFLSFQKTIAHYQTQQTAENARMLEDILLRMEENVIGVNSTETEKTVEHRYYIKEIDGTIVIYYGDKKTVFENTGISTEMLPDMAKRLVEDGFFVDNIVELYGILESFSS